MLQIMKSSDPNSLLTFKQAKLELLNVSPTIWISLSQCRQSEPNLLCSKFNPTQRNMSSFSFPCRDFHETHTNSPMPVSKTDSFSSSSSLFPEILLQKQ
mmetsp:Transcript_5275/g.10823  ORF Transcript_5275/g.10823 Transcript_5275/m.10823 type:complete len:99 (+) Transcript_5275:923-1219(+)